MGSPKHPRLFISQKGKSSVAIFPSAKKADRAQVPLVADPITVLVPLLTIKQVASYLNQSTRTVRRLVAQRKINCFKLDGELRFRFEDVERFLEKRYLRAA
jgi:excisionase family DNA binding protein